MRRAVSLFALYCCVSLSIESLLTEFLNPLISILRCILSDLDLTHRLSPVAAVQVSPASPCGPVLFVRHMGQSWSFYGSSDHEKLPSC